VTSPSEQSETFEGISQCRLSKRAWGLITWRHNGGKSKFPTKERALKEPADGIADRIHAINWLFFLKGLKDLLLVNGTRHSLSVEQGQRQPNLCKSKTLWETRRPRTWSAALLSECPGDSTLELSPIDPYSWRQRWHVSSMKSHRSGCRIKGLVMIFTASAGREQSCSRLDARQLLGLRNSLESNALSPLPHRRARHEPGGLGSVTFDNALTGRQDAGMYHSEMWNKS
jgi:hypothetical protein